MKGVRADCAFASSSRLPKGHGSSWRWAYGTATGSSRTTSSSLAGEALGAYLPLAGGRHPVRLLRAQSEPAALELRRRAAVKPSPSGPRRDAVRLTGPAGG